MNVTDIKNGFNKGYVLQKYAPALAKKFSKGLEGREDAFAQGFLSGVKEYNKERLIARAKDHKMPYVPKNKSRSKDKDRDFRDM